jgi:hypothetical protein
MPQIHEEITDHDRHLFTQGDCGLLARALHERTGWPMSSFCHPDDSTPSLHAFVKTLAGMYLDVEGEKPYADFMSRWAVLSTIPTLPPWIMREDIPWPHGWEESGWNHAHFTGSYRRAEIVASVLLDRWHQDHPEIRM